MNGNKQMLGKIETEIYVCQESEQKGGNGFIEMEETPGEPLVGWKVSTFPAFLGTQRIIMILKWKRKSAVFLDHTAKYNE